MTSTSSTAIRLLPEMFVGNNAVALRATFQKFAGKGVIITDVALIIEPVSLRKIVVIGYVKESEGKMTAQFNPDKPDSFRQHEFTRHEFKVKADPGQDYIDAHMLLNKLAFIGER